MCAVYSELFATEMFEEMSVSADEDEHSIEMQLPYIAKVMERFDTNCCCCWHSVVMSLVVMVKDAGNHTGSS